MNTLENVKQWFIDRDLENGGRLDKQSLKLSSESHAKWFERYFKKYNLEEKLKTSAQKGYTGYLINVWSVRDEYLRNRLEDKKTLEALRELLGAGFTVEYKFYLSKNFITGEDFVSNKKIHITW